MLQLIFAPKIVASSKTPPVGPDVPQDRASLSAHPAEAVHHGPVQDVGVIEVPQVFKSHLGRSVLTCPGTEPSRIGHHAVSFLSNRKKNLVGTFPRARRLLQE
jgi:hypothetical protein